MNSDNPASRLHLILQETRRHNNSSNQRTVWQQVLDLKDASDSKLLSQIGKVMALPEEINQWLKEKFPTKGWVSWKKSIDMAFSNIHLNGSWELVNKHISAYALTELDIISALYETNSGNKLISTEEITNFREKVNSLIDDVLDSDMSSDMKKIFIKYLKKINDALDSYQITGAEPIIDAVEAAMGHVVIDSEYKEELRKTGTGEQLVTFLGSLIDAVASAQGLPPVATPFLQLIKSE